MVKFSLLLLAIAGIFPILLKIFKPEIVMNKYLIKSLSTTRLILFSIIAFVLSFIFVFLTYNYIGKTIYPAITFIITIIISILLIKKNYWVNVEIKIDDLQLIINNKQLFIDKIKRYNFNETEHFFGCKIVFENYKLTLNVSKKNPDNYLKFKKDISTKIKLINKNKEDKIQKYNWYLTKSAKVYGYFMIFIMLVWIGVMLYFPEKFKWSNFGLFLLVTAGLLPIFIRIFSKSGKSKNKT